MSPGRLRNVAADWRLTSTTPGGVAGLLKTSRNLFIHGYFVFEFLTIGVLLSIQAVETSLKVRLDPRQSFAKLIDRAAADGLLDEGARGRLHAGRELRNDFSHPEAQVVWSFGMAASVITGSHEIVADLLPEPASDAP